jgi:hypothetical protein
MGRQKEKPGKPEDLPLLKLKIFKSFRGVEQRKHGNTGPIIFFFLIT